LIVRAAAANLVKHLLLAIGVYDRLLARARFPGVCVLGYHGVRGDNWPAGTMPFEGLHVRAGELRAHLRLLRRTCHPISLAQWRAALAGGPPLPRRPVLITFDDGYRNTLQFGLPILRELGIPAVLFVSTEAVARRHYYWWDAVARARGEAAVEPLKALPYEQWQREIEACACAINEADACAPMTSTETRVWAETPGCEVGAHTATHAILSRAVNDQQRGEIARSREALHEWTGKPIAAFAYPNGQAGTDYTAEAVELLAEEGFDIAFNTTARFAAASESPYERSRFMLFSGTSAAELAHRLCFSWHHINGRQPLRAE
jgi:peptidoglycan/xylan/chitin deacetylase (PgdA/CDA1 family)